VDTQLLKTFLEVQRVRHFGRAANNLFISQSTVSARIRLLEEELGVLLFTRDRNNIQLTSAGRKLLRHAENITTTWTRVQQELAMGEDGPELLTAGAVSTLWDIALHDWVQWVYTECPEIGLSTEVYGAETLLQRLTEGSMDLGFLFDPPPQSSGLMVAETLPVQLIMVSTERGLTSEQATRKNYLLVDWGTSYLIAHARHFPDMPTPRIRVGLGSVAKDLILSCGGSAYLAETMVKSEIQDGHLFPVEDAPPIGRTAYGVYPANSDRQSVIEKVLSYFSSLKGNP
jgi:LysR family transcriptional regulator, flagellar master operon regulator